MEYVRARPDCCFENAAAQPVYGIPIIHVGFVARASSSSSKHAVSLGVFIMARNVEQIKLWNPVEAEIWKFR